MKILVIGDRDERRLALAALLRRAMPDCETAVVPSGVAAVEQARAFQPDAALLNVEGLGSEAFEICRQLKHDSLTRDIPVVAVGPGPHDSARRIHALDSGADALLCDPVEPGELVAQVRALVRIKPVTLRERESQYRSLFEHMQEGLAYCQMQFVDGRPRDWVYLAVNRAFEALTGLHNVTGKRVSEVIPGIQESSSDLLERYGRVASTGKPDRFETYVAALDMWFAISAYSPKQGDFVAVFDVITERKRSEERLRQLSQAVEQSPASVVITDLQGRIEYVNAKFTEATGYLPHEVIGRNPRVLKSGEASVEYYRHLWNTILTGGVWRGQFHNRKKNGDLFWEQASIAPVRDDSGHTTHFVAVKEDITERKRVEQVQLDLEEQLRQARKAESIGLLAGGVAHDFNNLLTPILGYAEMIRADLPADNRHRNSLEEIRRAAERAAALTQQLLAFGGRQMLRLAAVDLRSIVAGFERLLRGAIREDISIETELPDAPVIVDADPGQIEQVIMNLALNAQGAMPTGGVLSVQLAAVVLDESAQVSPRVVPGRYGVLIVRDTGHGMDRTTMDRIFEPFFTTKGLGKGTGLGLSTVQGIVSQHGGAVRVESAPGRGATFSIFLPSEPTSASVTPPGVAPAKSAVAPRGHETVLLVEDDDALRDLARMMLERYGYRVIAAADGPECLAIAGDLDEPVHLLLTDVVMPRMNGRELFERLAAVRPGLTVLYMSGYTDDVIAYHGVHRKHVPLLQKPFTETALALRVREALDE